MPAEHKSVKTKPDPTRYYWETGTRLAIKHTSPAQDSPSYSYPQLVIQPRGSAGQSKPNRTIWNPLFLRHRFYTQPEEPHIAKGRPVCSAACRGAGGHAGFRTGLILDCRGLERYSADLGRLTEISSLRIELVRTLGRALVFLLYSGVIVDSKAR
jgi:hypothetical protein